MQPLFVSSPPLPRNTQAKRCVCRRTPYARNDRSPWPLTRFVQTLLFYSPLSRFTRRTPDTAGDLRTRVYAMQTGKQKVLPRVLVTGASGGVGRRVVRELLERGYDVRAMTRGRERLEKALGDVGVDLGKVEKEGKLEVIVTDLYNVREELLNGVTGVVSCTGVKVGTQDDPDRSKYYQGLKFYQPELMEDTPQNVEFIGMRNLVNGLKRWGGNVDVVDVMKMDKEVWGVLDDVVMGGVSKSQVGVERGVLVFKGTVSTDNFGGFASVRTVDFSPPLDLGGFDGIRMRALGDGQRYKLVVRCDGKWDGVGHCVSFDTKKGEWIDVNIPWEELRPVFRGKTVRDGDKFKPKSISALQLMLSKFEYDGDLNPNFKAGDFELKVDSIKAYRGEGVKFVHVSSAGVTRVLRSGEFNMEEQPPAVRMNSQLGRIMEWKLAGEDVLRESGLPYVILRSCALTEKDSVGEAGLRFEQGDQLRGQIGRDDLAKVCVDALERELSGVTTEVAWGEGGMWDQLKNDQEVDRPFASFPYVPTNYVNEFVTPQKS